MTPTKILAQLLKLDERAATIIFYGLGVMAAAAIVMTFKMDPNQLMKVGFMIIGFSVLVLVLRNIKGVLASIVTWAVTLTVLGIAAAFLVQSLTRPALLSPPLVSAGCFFTPLDPACQANLNVAELPEATPTDPSFPKGTTRTISIPAQMKTVTTRNTATGIVTTQSVVQSPAKEQVVVVPFDIPHSNAVVIQYSNAFGRASVKEISTVLGPKGWNFTPWDRTAAAFGFNEVRYFNPSDADVANAFAVQLNETGIVDAKVRVRDFSGSGLTAPPHQIELWVSN